MTLGEHLKIIREKNDLSLSQLAKISGVGKTHIWSIEKDKTNPSLPILEKLANAFHLTVTDLVTEEVSIFETSEKIMNIVKTLPEFEQKKVLKLLEIIYC